MCFYSKICVSSHTNSQTLLQQFHFWNQANKPLSFCSSDDHQINSTSRCVTWNTCHKLHVAHAPSSVNCEGEDTEISPKLLDWCWVLGTFVFMRSWYCRVVSELSILIKTSHLSLLWLEIVSNPNSSPWASQEPLLLIKEGRWCRGIFLKFTIQWTHTNTHKKAGYKVRSTQKS